MAYALHIERRTINDDREATPIPLDDWKLAVSATPGVRLSPPDADYSVTNPKTGQRICFPRRDGDTEVFFPDEDQWLFVFHWHGGAAHVNARFNMGDPQDPVWVAAVILTKRLDAVLRGDGGETYDLQSGKEIRRAL